MALRIVLVSRDLHPVVEGDVGEAVAASARMLAGQADVYLLTTERHRPAYERLRAAGDPRLADDVQVLFAWDSEDIGNFHSDAQAWSSRVFDALCEHFPGGGPELVEFPDRDGEGFVTVQARRALDPRIRRSDLRVRLHGTSELRTILNGRWPAEFAERATFAAERYCLRHADRLLAPSEGVAATYERFYGALAPLVASVPPLAEEVRMSVPARTGDGPVRMLYADRLERAKGVVGLVGALLAVPGDDWRLTLAGTDTATASLGRSIRALLESMIDGDLRIRFADREDPTELIGHHDVLVAPALWDCWPRTVVRSLAHGVPVLATPVGGLTRLAEPGRGGWLTPGTTQQAIGQGLRALLDAPSAITELKRSDAPRRLFRELESGATRAALDSRAAVGSSRASDRSEPGPNPLVSVIIPYYEADAFIGDAIGSVVAQSYAPIELIVVNDGSFRAQDSSLYELAERHEFRVVTQSNSGVGPARNLGAEIAEGEYLSFLDADDVMERSLIERCVQILEERPEVAYVSAWMSFIEPDGRHATEIGGGSMPFGNWTELADERNIGGHSALTLRRRLFDRGFRYRDEMAYAEDHQLYRELRWADHYGEVIPEKLYRYRIRAGSMTREYDASSLLQSGQVEEELAGVTRRESMNWIHGSGRKVNDGPAADPIGPLDETERLRRAVAALERANAQLARNRIGTGGQAASSRLVKLADLEAEVERLRAELSRVQSADSSPMRHRLRALLGRRA